MWSAIFKPRAWLAKLLLVVLVAGFFSLGYFDQLKSIKQTLESDWLSFTIGESKFTAFMITQAVLAVIILLWFAGIFSEFVEKRIQGLHGMRPGNKSLVIKTFQIALYFLVFLVTLTLLGIDLTALAIFSGAVGIGIGFGLQKITSNFISGIILLFEKSVENDDLVELTDGTYGFIRHTRARYTLIETFEGKEILIPNEDFITNRVTNWTFSNSKGRVEINMGISYESDIEKAMEIMLAAAQEHPRCAKEPEPVCYLREFGDSSINFLLFFWVDDVTEGRYEPQSDVMRVIWKRFKENNIGIPFPQRDLHIKNIGELK